MCSKKHHEIGTCRRGSEASIACLLNRKLGVLHVALVLLEQRVDPRQLFQYLRQRRSIGRVVGSRFPCCLTDVLRRTNARPL